jgi:phosphoribosylformimino-5-aminoimidazole carboxamide ribotide isomerase
LQTQKAVMQIWPAIDLLGGKCVRLQQGDYARETVYADDPAQQARQFEQDGAEFLHLVDLDGARAGRPMNLDAVRAIVSAVGMQCELGGGIRDEGTIQSLLDLGLKRLVLGTSALKRPDWFRQMCEKFPDRLSLGVDARNGLVATDGWLETSSMPAVELVAQFAAVPLASIIYTDIATDGMLQGPNVAAMREMQQATSAPVIASGGVTTAEDVAALAEAGLAGAIIGRALYAGTLTIPVALEAARLGAARAPV